MGSPDPLEACICGSGNPWGQCCGPAVSGTTPAPTAEALMRSRYSAFVIGDVDHLVRSWHRDTCPDDVTIVEGQQWTGLDIIATQRGRALDADGTVEFRAEFTRDGRPGTLHETSRFVRVDGRWVYVDGNARW